VRSAKQSTPPPLYDVLMSLKEDVLQSFRVCVPGTVDLVNADGTVDVEVALMRRDLFGASSRYPILPSCPVVTAQGGGLALSLPVAKGDRCLVVFSDRCIDNWRKSGSPQPLANLRMHDLSDGFVLVGINPANSPLSTPPMQAGEGGLSETMPGAAVAIDTALHLVAIRNNTQSLLTLLQSLITAINGIVKVGGPTTQAVSPASQAVLSALSAQLALLLKP